MILPCLKKEMVLLNESRSNLLRLTATPFKTGRCLLQELVGSSPGSAGKMNWASLAAAAEQAGLATSWLSRRFWPAEGDRNPDFGSAETGTFMIVVDRGRPGMPSRPARLTRSAGRVKR